jgi:hypothetical protein
MCTKCSPGGIDMLESPYLKHNRIADVLAALQVMALNSPYRMSCKDWAFKISGDEEKSKYWRAIFDEHPEFFRKSTLSDDSYALIWRRALPRRYDRATKQLITDAEYDALSAQEKAKITRPAVPESQIKTLMDMAVDLHSRAVEANRDWRWWIAPALSFGGSFVGALIAFAAAALFKR